MKECSYTYLGAAFRFLWYSVPINLKWPIMLVFENNCLAVPLLKRYYRWLLCFYTATMISRHQLHLLWKSVWSGRISRRHTTFSLTCNWQTQPSTNSEIWVQLPRSDQWPINHVSKSENEHSNSSAMHSEEKIKLWIYYI